jgi:hypothetical protein
LPFFKVGKEMQMEIDSFLNSMMDGFWELWESINGNTWSTVARWETRWQTEKTNISL